MALKTHEGSGIKLCYYYLQKSRENLLFTNTAGDWSEILCEKSLGPQIILPVKLKNPPLRSNGGPISTCPEGNEGDTGYFGEILPQWDCHTKFAGSMRSDASLTMLIGWCLGHHHPLLPRLIFNHHIASSAIALPNEW